MTSIWAHRGASGTAPENTMPAFERAVELGADGIELDLQRSADGRLVVCHDETVDRTSNGHGAIVDLTWEHLSTLDFSNGDERFAGVRMPLLEEVFELVRAAGITLNVELKDSVERYPGMGDQARQLAASMGVGEQIIWSSFNHNSLAEMHRSDPSARLGVLFSEPLFEPWDYARRIGACAIHPDGYSLGMMPDVIARCHDAGIAVNVWTINETSDMRAAQQAGVDAIITNFPERARQV